MKQTMHVYALKRARRYKRAVVARKRAEAAGYVFLSPLKLQQSAWKPSWTSPERKAKR